MTQETINERLANNPMIKILKRDGKSIVEYNPNKIYNVLRLAMSEDKDLGIDEEKIKVIEQEIYDELLLHKELHANELTVENIQDMVEDSLLRHERKQTAKDYIRYRAKKEDLRNNWKPYKKFNFLSDEFLKQFATNQNPFDSQISKFTFYRTYSRFIPELKRRENWLEMCARVADYITELDPKGSSKKAENLFLKMFNFSLFSSGRIRYTGGTESIKRNFQSAFNCSYVKIDNVDMFAETAYLLMLGCGVGYSLYKEDIQKIQPLRYDIEVISKNYEPVEKNSRQEMTTTTLHHNSILEIIVGDSKSAWSNAIQIYFDTLSNRGMSSADNLVNTILFNFDHVRPSGEILKTFGGYASGHKPLMKTLEGIDKVIKESKGKKISRNRLKLKSIDVLDIMSLIASAIVSGGR